jgi:nitrite reductase (NADH) large subunit
MVYGLVAPLWDQGRVLADNITGANADARYRGSKLSTKLKVMGLDLASIGMAAKTEEGDEVVQWVEPSKGRYKKLVIRDGKLVGAILLGETSTAGRLMQLYERGGMLPESREQLLFEMTAPVAKGGAMLEMPDAATVCNCNGVSKGTIRTCVLKGAKNLNDVMSATRAGSGCGSCKSLVSEIVEWTKASAS